MTSATKALFLLAVAICLFLSQTADAQGRKKRPTPGQSFQEKSVTQQQQQRQNVESSVECPEPFGFFADAEQCDKYYVCENGVAKPKLCADGLVFLEAGSSIEKCEFSFAVDCTTRPKLQTPQPSLNCPRKNGYFAHEDDKICDKFFFCVDGNHNAITCPAGLVFNDKTGTCTWPDLAKKSHCSSGDIFEFQCPKVPESQAGQAVHPRYADPKDCQLFYFCVDGKTARRGGCSTGQVFNEKTGQCDKPLNVPECKDWYKGILDYDEEGEIVTTARPKPKQPASGGGSGRRKGVKRPAHADVERV